MAGHLADAVADPLEAVLADVTPAVVPAVGVVDPLEPGRDGRRLDRPVRDVRELLAEAVEDVRLEVGRDGLERVEPRLLRVPLVGGRSRMPSAASAATARSRYASENRPIPSSTTDRTVRPLTSTSRSNASYGVMIDGLRVREHKSSTSADGRTTPDRGAASATAGRRGHVSAILTKT